MCAKGRGDRDIAAAAGRAGAGGVLSTFYVLIWLTFNKFTTFSFAHNIFPYLLTEVISLRALPDYFEILIILPFTASGETVDTNKTNHKSLNKKATWNLNIVNLPSLKPYSRKKITFTRVFYSTPPLFLFKYNFNLSKWILSKNYF